MDFWPSARKEVVSFDRVPSINSMQIVASPRSLRASAHSLCATYIGADGTSIARHEMLPLFYENVNFQCVVFSLDASVFGVIWSPGIESLVCAGLISRSLNQLGSGLHRWRNIGTAIDFATAKRDFRLIRINLQL